MKFEINMVDVDLINIDREYQRDLDEKRVEKLAKAFNSGAVKAVSLSRRGDGSLWVYDGQHSLEIMKRIGIKKIPAVITQGSQQQEAFWFGLINGAGVRKASQRDWQKAGVVCGEAISLEISKLLDAYGLKIAKGGAKKGTTSAIGSLKAWIKSDYPRLTNAMDMVNRLWCNEDHAWTQIVLRGAWDVAGTDQLMQVEKGLSKNKVTPRRVLDVACAMQSSTGINGGGSGYAKQAFFKLAKVQIK